jgi:hypothetical protein
MGVTFLQEKKEREGEGTFLEANRRAVNSDSWMFSCPGGPAIVTIFRWPLSGRSERCAAYSIVQRGQI